MKIEIKEPCSADWSKMKIGLHSRHCESCEKSVIDFTEKSRAEIIAYVLSNPNESTCGRLSKDQFDFKHEDIPVLITELKKSKYPNPFLILALVSLSLSSCTQQKEESIVPESQPVEVVKHLKDTSTDSIPNLQPKSTPIKIVEPDTIVKNLTVGMVDPVFMGDVCVLEPTNDTIPMLTEPEIDVPETERQVYKFTEQMPEFPGGVDSMMAFISDNLNYPEYEKNNGIQGNVYAQFIVEIDGSITSINILRSIDGSKNCDDEVIRVISSMPKWKAGEQNEKKVASYMTLPFRFKLQ